MCSAAPAAGGPHLLPEQEEQAALQQEGHKGSVSRQEGREGKGGEREGRGTEGINVVSDYLMCTITS